MYTDEQAYYQKVRGYIERELAAMQDAQRDERRSIRERNRALIEENPFASVYGRAENVRRTNEKGLAEIDALERRRIVLKKMLDAPYFGRVDFLFDGEREAEVFYVGLTSVSDLDSGEILVYDWRAPVSSLFYTGEIGRASYQAPAGEISGEITRIRQYRFLDGKLIRFWDAELQIDDSVLRDVLSGAAAQSMKPIVSTIQREQNRAIRYDGKKNLAVFGPAGCGKTSVGMHRLSWIAYKMQKDGMIPDLQMFTGNEAFRSFIAGVLPELGERNVRSVDFSQLFGKYLQGIRVQPQLSQTEAFLKKDPVRMNRVGKLYDPGFIRYVDAHLSETHLRFVNVVLFGEVVVSAEDLYLKYQAMPARTSVRKRLETLADWTAGEISNYYLIRKKELLDLFLREVESGDSYTQAYRMHRERAVSASRQMVLSAADNDPSFLLLSFLQDYYADPVLSADVKEALDAGSVYYEEALVLLLIAVRLQGGPRLPDHILVDEAQDLSPLHHMIIRELYPKGVFTILADERQGIVPAVNTPQETLVSGYDAAVMTLNRSYRSTREISEYAKHFLPAGTDDYESFARAGEEPDLRITSDVVHTAADIIRSDSEIFGIVCVILPYSGLSASFYNALRSMIPDIRLIDTERKPLGGGVVCMPAALTKGLEFDSVILPYAELTQQDPCLAYLTATRALHRLHVLYSSHEGTTIGECADAPEAFAAEE